MTGLHTRLRLTLQHAYYGELTPPIVATPLEPRAFHAAGLLLRQKGALIEVVSQAGFADQATAIDLCLTATEPELYAATKSAEWQKLPSLLIPLGMAEATFNDAMPLQDKASPQDLTLSHVTVALPEAGGRDVTLQFEAVEAYWAYHVVGSGLTGELNVVDKAGQVAFEPKGKSKLADGREAKVFRSATPLPIAGADRRFALLRGTDEVISVLPAPGLPLHESADGQALEAHIYVTIF